MGADDSRTRIWFVLLVGLLSAQGERFPQLTHLAVIRTDPRIV